MNRLALVLAMLVPAECLSGCAAAQEPPPPPAVGDHPNEPPGYEVIGDAVVDRLPTTNGDSIGIFEYWNLPMMTVVPDGNPVEGRDGFIEAVTPAFHPTGEAGGVVLTYAHEGYDELYISMWDWVAPNYTWHGSDNKRLIVDGGERMIFSIRGRDSGPGKWFMSNYSANGELTNIEPSRSAPTFQRGRWNHTEFILRHSGGELKVIMNGQVALHLTNQRFDDPAWGGKLEWLNLYGGTGGNAGQEQRSRLGELYVSGRRR